MKSLSFTAGLSLGLASFFLLGSAWGADYSFADDTAMEAYAVAEKPIPPGPTPLSLTDDKLASGQWLNTQFVDALAQDPDKSAAWMPDAVAFMRDRVKIMNRQSDKPDIASMALRGKELVEKGCDHPLILAAISQLVTDPAESLALAQKACDIFAAPSSKYPPLWHYWARIILSDIMLSANQKNDLVKANDRLAVALLPSILNENNFPKGSDEALIWTVYRVQNGVFFDRNDQAIIPILQKSGLAPQWLLLTLKGYSETNLAWSARGSGWANSVTSAGWKGMKDHIALARQYLTKAWEIDPKQPLICHAMLTVVLGSSGDDPAGEMRLWFDRAVQLEFDYNPVYTSFIYGLKPRWFGSHRAQLAFGEQCIATGRYDTDVPHMYLECLRSIAGDNVKIPVLYRQKEIGPKIDTMLDGYLAEKNRPRAIGYYRTLKICFALCRGDIGQATSLFQENGRDLDSDACDAVYMHRDQALQVLRSQSPPAK